MTRDLVCLHGINNTGRAFDGLDRAYLQEWQIHTPDLPALGDVDRIADHLLAALPESFVLIGHSFGGYVALAIMSRAPERVRGLVLINSSDGADSPAMAARRHELAAKAEAGGYAELAEAATAITYHADALGRPKLMEARTRDLAAELRAELAEHGRDVHADLLEHPPLHHAHHAAAAARAVPGGADEPARRQVGMRPRGERILDRLERRAEPIAQFLEPGPGGLLPRIRKRGHAATIMATPVRVNGRGPRGCGTGVRPYLRSWPRGRCRAATPCL